MPVKNIIVVLMVVPLLLVAGLAACTGVLRGPLTSGEKAFLASLQGEIVYIHTDDRYDNIYKINANGTNKKLLLRTDGPEYHFRCFNPLWSEDGTKIYFTAYKDGAERTFVMDANGGNIELEGSRRPYSVLESSREPDIIVQKGNVFWLDAEGGLHQVYKYPFHAEFDSASRYASWSPDRKFIVFVTALHNIIITNREGTMVVKITDGEAPDWKY